MKINNLKKPFMQIQKYQVKTKNGEFKGIYFRIYRLVLGFGMNWLKT